MLVLQIFFSCILNWVFSGSRHRSFGVHARGPPCGVKSAVGIFLHGSLHGLSIVGPHWDFLFGFLQIFLQSVLSGYFNVVLSTSEFLQLGMLVLGGVACRPGCRAKRVA